jgi:hypothetical protein
MAGQHLVLYYITGHLQVILLHGWSSSGHSTAWLVIFRSFYCMVGHLQVILLHGWSPSGHSTAWLVIFRSLCMYFMLAILRSLYYMVEHLHFFTTWQVIFRSLCFKAGYLQVSATCLTILLGYCCMVGILHVTSLWLIIHPQTDLLQATIEYLGVQYIVTCIL